MSLAHREKDDIAAQEEAFDVKPTLSADEYAPVGRENLREWSLSNDDYYGAKHFDPSFTWDAAEEKKVRLKTDFMLLSVICLMFFGLQLDRGNVSNALADNLLKDLNLTQNDYNNGTTIQLLAFLSFEFPSQIVCARVGFKRWLPFLYCSQGLVSLFQCFMTNRAGFYVTRLLIGALQSGFIPGAVVMTSHFYTSKELAIRLCWFWSTLNVARVCSALLAAGILQMRGIAGRPGWFWLFALEGALTCVIAIFAYCWLPESPTKTTGVFWRKPWFTEREEKIMINRVLRDDPAKGLTALHNKISFADIKDALSDRHLWPLIFLGLIAYIPQSPVQGYLTYNLKQLGFSTFNRVPSAALQIVTMLAISWSSNHFNERLYHCMFGEFWAMPILIAMNTLADGGREWARFSMVTLIAGYPYFHPILTSTISENSFSTKRRSMQITGYNVVVQIGSVVSSQIYRKDDAPYYHRGNKILVSICGLALITFALTRWYFGYLNNQKEKIWSAMTAEEKWAYQEDITAREKEGSNRLDFRLTR
ncbi:hypothetical protein FFLO_05728 [Filobasidium floriforme]|uniref:Major facilitator superfamily transporter n=1 Tax=Filobasidium floriforme TaxID=5210 RepID=A0A8K0JLU7_9TREE|nr:hypothetical protein FFLO_05728 [Filobasidium floriforme]